MKTQELKEEPLFMLYSPDGAPQFSTMAPSPMMCIAMLTVLAKKGIGQSYKDLKDQGFEILPVLVTAKVMC